MSNKDVVEPLLADAPEDYSDVLLPVTNAQDAPVGSSINSLAPIPALPTTASGAGSNNNGEEEDDDDNVDLTKFKDDDADPAAAAAGPGGATTTLATPGDDDEKPAPVSCAALFRFATCFDIFLIIIGTLASLCNGLLMPLSSLIMGDVLNKMQKPEDFKESVNEICFYFFAFGVISLICGVFQTFCFNLSSERQARVLRVTYLRRLLSQKMSFHDKFTKNVASSLSDYTQTVQAGLGDKLGGTVANFAAFIFALVLAFTKGAKFAAMLCIPLPILFIIIGVVMSRVAKLTVAEQKAYANANTIAQETFDGIKEVNVFLMQGSLIKKYKNYLKEAYLHGKSSSFAKATAFMSFLTLMFSMYAWGIYYGGVYLIAKGAKNGAGEPYTGGMIIAIFYTMLSGMQSVGQSMPNLALIAAARASMAYLLKVIDHRDEVEIDPFDFVVDFTNDLEQHMKELKRKGLDRVHTAHSNPQNNFGFVFDAKKHNKHLVTRLNFTGSVKFDNVSFSYPSRPDVEVLHNFTFHFEKYKKYGICGPSGSSKSTCLGLLQRFYDPNEGNVWVEIFKDINPAAPLLNTTTIIQPDHPTEWVNLRDIYIGPWRKYCVGLAVQETTFFTGSIADNIKLGNPLATNAEVITAARLAHAHDFIMQKDEQYNYFLQQNLANLSGGEGARVGLARVLLMRPTTLLLDEQTAALDYLTENIVTKNVHTLFIEDNEQQNKMKQQNNNDEHFQQEQQQLSFTNTNTTNTPTRQKQAPGTPHIKCMISVAHRLITIRNADVIIVMDNGKIVEHGTHDELLEHKEDGLYYKLFTAHPDPTMMINNNNNNTPNNTNNKNNTTKTNNFILTKEQEQQYQQNIFIKPTNFIMSIDQFTKQKKDSAKKTRANRKYQIRRLLKDIFTTHPFLMTLALISIFIGGASFPLFSEIFGHALKALYEPKHEDLIHNVKKYALLFVVFAVSAGFNTFITQAVLGVVGEKMILKFRSELYENVIQQELAFFDRETNSSSALTTKLAKDTTQIRVFISQILAGLLSLLAQITISFVLSYRINKEFTLIMLAIFPFSIASSLLHFQFIRGFAHSAKNFYESAGSVAIEAIKSFKTLSSFNAENFTFLQFTQLQTKQINIATLAGLWGGLGLGISQLLFYSCQAASYYFGAELVIQHKLEFYQFFQIYQSMRFASQQLSMVLSQVSTLDQVNAAVSDMYDLMDRETLIDQYLVKEEEKKNIATKPKQIENDNNNFTGCVEFKNVNFHYPTNRDKRILRNVSFKTDFSKMGQDFDAQNKNNADENDQNKTKQFKLSLVGKTGCGKSTIMALLLKFYVSIQENGNERLLMHKKYEYFNQRDINNNNNGAMNKNKNMPINNNDHDYNDVLITVNAKNSDDNNNNYNTMNNDNLVFNKNTVNMSPDELYMYNQQKERDLEFGGALRNPLQSGQILIDNVDIMTMTQRELCNTVSIVFQKPHIFKDTVLENIKCGRDDLTMEEVIEACRVAQIYDFIQKLPQKFDTKIDKTKLSGGQAQRLTIARAIARNPKIMLLDEISASIDTLNSKRIEQALNKAMANRVSIAIAHKLESLFNSQQILVMDQGCIVEQGDYQELIAMSQARKERGEAPGVFASFLESSALQ